MSEPTFDCNLFHLNLTLTAGFILLISLHLPSLTPSPTHSPYGLLIHDVEKGIPEPRKKTSILRKGGFPRDQSPCMSLHAMSLTFLADPPLWFLIARYTCSFLKWHLLMELWVHPRVLLLSTRRWWNGLSIPIPRLCVCSTCSFQSKKKPKWRKKTEPAEEKKPLYLSLHLIAILIWTQSCLLDYILLTYLPSSLI